jgi:hypothetical protein
MMLRNIGANPPPRASISVSAGRESHDRSSQPHNFPGQMHYGHTFVPKADKYRTVPCKYYHRYLSLYLAISGATKLITALISMTKDMQESRCRLTTSHLTKATSLFPKGQVATSRVCTTTLRLMVDLLLFLRVNPVLFALFRLHDASILQQP